MRELSYGAVIEVIAKHDRHSADGGEPLDADVAELMRALAGHFAGAEELQSVLGIDIYQYSRYSPETQRLIPSVFNFLKTLAIRICEDREPFLFQQHKFEDRFISTGDGGFLLFDTPLHAVVFACYFQAVLTWFNGYLMFPKLRKAVGPISLRYAITYDYVFRQDQNYFGSAIISNARILSRDALNRCLIDGTSVNWFNANTVNVEALMTLTPDIIATLPAFGGYEKKESKSILFTNSSFTLDTAFRSVHLQKVGVVAAKMSQHDVYNLYLQVGIARNREDGTSRTILITLGNLNVGGIAA